GVGGGPAPVLGGAGAARAAPRRPGSRHGGAGERWTGPQEGGRARERAGWPAGVWGSGSAQRVRRTREHWTGPQEGGRARERSSWPTGVWGHRKRAARAVQARAVYGPPEGRPSARALELADGGSGGIGSAQRVRCRREHW